MKMLAMAAQDAPVLGGRERGGRAVPVPIPMPAPR